MQKALLIVAILAFTAFASVQVNTDEVKVLWSSWKMYHGKTYTSAEEGARFAIFMENYKKVVTNNAAGRSVKFSLNKFADLTAAEFKSIYASGYVKKNTRVAPTEFTKLQDLPSSVDWRKQGAVTKVKDQGQCGSCWTFATTGALEGWYKINKGVLLSFSEQQIVDCDTNDQGCDGGDPIEALTYTAQNGLNLEALYPYKEFQGKCQFKPAVAVVTNGNSSLVTPKDSQALLTALVTQPVSVAIEADEDSFQFYDSGVLYNDCGDNLDHAVLVVGYQNLGKSDEAFIVKNSWGTDWGDGGYILLSTDQKSNKGNGVCGILAQPVVPTN